MMSEMTEARAVTKVSAFSAPLVVTCIIVWNIQKKLLLTCSANKAPEPMARPMMIGETSS